MGTPLVSVIIPNFNHARYLNERIDSILAQTYQNFELIILDDCSTDNSRDVIEQYRNNPHINHIVYNETNSGSPFKQWLKGITLAKGEYCWIAESDDSCRPQLLEKLVVQTTRHNNVVLALCRTFFTNENLEIQEGIIPITKSKVYRGPKFIAKHMIDGNGVCNAGMALFRREDALKLDSDFMNPIYAGAGDYVFWIKMAERGNVALVNEPLNLFRRYPTTVTSRKDADGSNSNARLLILNYILSKKYIKEFQAYKIHTKELLALDRIHGMPDATRSMLKEKWSLNEKQVKLLKFLEFINAPYERVYKLLRFITSPSRWHFRKARINLIVKQGLSIHEFANIYYKMTNTENT